MGEIHFKTSVATKRNGSSSEETNCHTISVPKVVSAGLSGLAGGVAVATVIAGGAISIPFIAAGSIIGAAITGSAEYIKEKKELTAK